MLRLKFRHLIVLIILLPYLLGSTGCWDDPPSQGPSPPDAPGVGTGDYKFSLVDSLPDVFDCNDSGRFSG